MVSDLMLTKQQIEDFREAFSLFTSDDDGTIRVEELTLVMKALGSQITSNELDDIIADMDMSGNGFLEFPEFVILLTSHMMNLSKEEEIISSFKVIDTKKDGNIDLAELKYFMRKVAFIKISDEEAQAMI